MKRSMECEMERSIECFVCMLLGFLVPATVSDVVTVLVHDLDG